MSAAAGPVLASADAIASRERFIQDRTVNTLCFTIVRNIANELNKNQNVRFFVKGGAAATLSITGKPLEIINDIDCTVLVKPTLNPDAFELNRIYAAKICIERIVGTLYHITTMDLSKIQSAYSRYGLTSLPTDPSIRIGHATSDSYTLLEELNKYIPTITALRPDCPFFIDIWPSLMFGKKSLQMAVLKIRTHTEPSLDLIDIALPAKTYERLSYEWEEYKTDPFTIQKNIRIPILAPDAQIKNQAYARIKTVTGMSDAQNKKALRRNARINALTAKFAPTLAAPLSSLLTSAGPVATSVAAGGAGAGAAAGGAGAAAPGYPLPPARSVTRKNNTSGSKAKPHNTRKNTRVTPVATTETASAAATAHRKVLPYSLIPAYPNILNSMRRREVILQHNSRGKPLRFKEGNIKEGAIRYVYRNQRNGRLAEMAYWGPDGKLHKVGDMAIVNPNTFQLIGVRGMKNGSPYNYLFEFE